MNKNLESFIRHYVRSCDETIPEALQKILRPTGSTLLGGGYTVRTLRSIAFQPCITLGGVYWVEMGQNNDFLQKSGQKTAFLSITILDHPTLDWAGTQNFKGIAKVNMCFKKIGT